MADNSSIPVASGNETFANNDIGGVKYPRTKMAWGGAGVANDTDVATGKPLPIQLRSSTGIALEAVSAAATFTPAASSHTANDCVGAAQEFALGATSGARVMLTSATLYIDNTAALATAWRLHLYNVTPSSAIADDAAWDFADADVAQYLGFIDLPSTATDLGTNQFVQIDGLNKQIKLTGTSVFGYLQNLSTVTLTASAHQVTLHGQVVG
jgi:hypothetical protein